MLHGEGLTIAENRLSVGSGLKTPRSTWGCCLPGQVVGKKVKGTTKRFVGLGKSEAKKVADVFSSARRRIR